MYMHMYIKLFFLFLLNVHAGFSSLDLKCYYLKPRLLVTYNLTEVFNLSNHVVAEIKCIKQLE